MRRLSSFALLSGAAFLLVSSPAPATSVSFDLNRDITRPTCARFINVLEANGQGWFGSISCDRCPAQHSGATRRIGAAFESASLLLFGAGLGLIGFRMRRGKIKKR